MNRLRFHTARLLRNEAALRAMSVPQGNLLADLEGRTVALIGNARALTGGDSGARIDAADLVIRINRAPIPAPASHGSRTDWLALATRLNEADRARLSPDRILWMSPKRKRLDWRSAASPGFYLHPLADYAALRDRLSAPHHRRADRRPAAAVAPAQPDAFRLRLLRLAQPVGPPQRAAGPA